MLSDHLHDSAGHSALKGVGTTDTLSLVDRLLDLVAEGTVGSGGVLTITRGLEFLELVRELSSAHGTPSVDTELVFDERWITTQDAARRMGCTPRWARTLATRNVLSARQIDGRWLIDSASIGRRPVEPGNPTGQEGTQ